MHVFACGLIHSFIHLFIYSYKTGTRYRWSIVDVVSCEIRSATLQRPGSGYKMRPVSFNLGLVAATQQRFRLLIKPQKHTAALQPNQPVVVRVARHYCL